jgi:lysyl-tRNA synthetase class 2
MDRLTMLLTGQESIQEVLLFPQMRPEKAVRRDPPEKYGAHGIGEAWTPVLHKAGYTTVEQLAEANPQLVRQALFDINKKYSLGLELPSAQEVEGWIQSVTQTQAKDEAPR